ncbi:hypothetical protein CALCODRAFT_508041 [Calocera cornea HHB12733]|uniref:Uncharacterized protein n=1 Tax=Calocera cornea HHB12733 TaxID=1353952 RepID=A0A165GWQ4_9BASI|nr:hypothetical protein CALCODRAFT_508041 [Calocera cornea HHB12733]
MLPRRKTFPCAVFNSIASVTAVLHLSIMLPSRVASSTKSSTPNHNDLDTQILARLSFYGAVETFNTALTLVAVSYCDLENAAEFVHLNPWVVGILEAAFHLKVFKIVRELPVLHVSPKSQSTVKIELLELPDLQAVHKEQLQSVTTAEQTPTGTKDREGQKNGVSSKPTIEKRRKESKDH